MPREEYEHKFDEIVKKPENPANVKKPTTDSKVSSTDKPSQKIEKENKNISVKSTPRSSGSNSRRNSINDKNRINRPEM